MEDDPDIRLHYAMVLHDLNNLIHGLLAWMEPSSFPDEPECQERIAHMHAATVQTARFLERQLDVLTDDRGPSDTRVVTDTLKLLTPVVPAGVSIRTAIPDEPLEVGLGAVPLQRITLNLLLNALEHARTSVRVEVGPRRGGVAMMIWNDGPRVRRPRPTASRSRGLGLEACRTIVETAGGALSMSVQDGVRVEVSLPAPPVRRRSAHGDYDAASSTGPEP